MAFQLKRGQGIGAHAELLAAGGVYARLYHIKFRTQAGGEYSAAS